MHIIDYLESKGLVVKEGGNGNIYTHCMFCNEDENKRGRLYLQADETSDNYGAWYCFLCGSKGGLNSIRGFYGDAPIGETKTHPRLLSTAVEYLEERLLEYQPAYEYLVRKRGLTDEKIRSMRLGWDDGGLITHLVASGFSLELIEESGLANHFGTDFLENHITIPYLEYGQPVGLRGKSMKGKYLSLRNSQSRLFGLDTIRGEDTVLIAAGEFDQAVLSQFGYPAIGVPGENVWKTEWTEELVDARRIYILFDNDKAGKAGAEKLATKLGPRTRIVELPNSNKRKKVDVSSYYVDQGKTKEDFDFLLQKAQGGLLVSASQAFDRWTEVEGNPNLHGLRFNIPSIDNEMSHGLLPGQVVVVISKSNAGKTLATLNLFHRMALQRPSIRILYLSLEQTRNEWFERAHRINNFYEPGSSTLDTIKFWEDKLYLVDKNRITEEELEVCLDQYEYETGYLPDIVAVDYLGYYARAFPGEEYARVTSAIMGLKAIAKKRQIVFMVPHQVNRSGDYGQELQADQGKGSGAVEETADMLIALWNPDQRRDVHKADQKKELRMKILKSRDGGVGRMVQLQFAPLTLAIVPTEDDLYQRALRERQYWLAGDDWQKAVYRHLTGDNSL